jgi:DNA repair exonuclease SbcCD ATPase subunit
MKDLHLIEFEANSFAGIDKEQPVIIHFKNKPVTLLRGDQGTNKSSTLNALMSVMGAVFNFETKNFVNKKDDTIDVKLKFNHKGTDYEVMQSGNRVTLKRFYKESNKWIAEGSPKETLREIFGNLGVSPIFLKDLPGKKQIEWFKETFGATEDVSKKEKKLQADLEKIFAQRRDLNRAIKETDGALKSNVLYKNYEKNQAKFAKHLSAEKEKEKLQTLQTKKEEFDKAKSVLDNLKEKRKGHTDRIAQLQKQIDEEVQSRSLVEKRIADGEVYIAASNGIEKEYSEANEAYLNISKTIAEQTQWKDVLKKEKDLDEMEQTVVLATDQIAQLRVAILELTSTYLPKIKGLEIRTKGFSIDTGDEDEGIFYQDKSLAQLSESELWDLFLLIWEKMEVYFVFCENISSLGSQAVQTLNRLAKEKKAQIFASEVDRKKDTMEISFETKIA